MKLTVDKKAKLFSLLSAKKDIETALRSHRDSLDALHQNRIFELDDVMRFANCITQTIRAPKDWSPGLPLCGHPPTPMLEQIRAGALEAYYLRCKEAAQRSAAVAMTSDSNIPAEALPTQVNHSSMSSKEQYSLDLSRNSEIEKFSNISESIQDSSPVPSKRMRVEANVSTSTVTQYSQERKDSKLSQFSEVLTSAPISMVVVDTDPTVPAALEPNNQDTPIVVPLPPAKVQRNISISFGMSDSSDDEDE